MVILCLSFEQLSLEQLYATMRLRQEVFVVEQDCSYLDADGKDQLSYHLLIYIKDELAAYTRLVPPGVSYEDFASIGRVVNAEKFRGQGIGKTLMETSIETCKKLFPNTDIKISAQCYLQKFYSEFGFEDLGIRYDEDGIPHMAMMLKNRDNG